MDAIFQPLRENLRGGVQKRREGEGKEQLSPFRNWCMLLRMADFTREFTLVITQHELVNRNFAAASVHRNAQREVFIAGPLFLCT